MKNFEDCPKCGYHLIKHSTFAECARCLYKGETLEHMNKISRELGFKDYDNYINFTKRIQKYEGVTYSKLK